ncbi:G-protein coupled receptor GRL101-like [Physella acuta]|uniref:G-protein coupled receptor GRL101-like n=1 Tax=Physella acuta TaxID=109671 RepID=UPI0027DD348D|nr:G-protein coupled receptor GRL101-like [Physella acuta]
MRILVFGLVFAMVAALSSWQGDITEQNRYDDYGRAIEPKSEDYVNGPDVNDQYRCINMADIKNRQSKNFPTAKIPPYKNSDERCIITIENRTSCSQTRNINVTKPTLINVTVETCCITMCTHLTQVVVPDDNHILLNFLHFKVPGLNLLRSEALGECDESLQVSVEAVPKNGAHAPKTHRFGTFCGIKQPTAIFVEYSKVNLSLHMLDNKQCVDKISYVVQVSPCLRTQYDNCSSPKYIDLTNKDRGYISSPGLRDKQNYPNDLNCTWTITVPTDKLIRLNAEIIRLRPGDVIKITLSGHYEARFPRELYFTDLNFTQPVILPTHECQMSFFSDSIESGVGFNISYTSVSPSRFIPMFDNSSYDCSNLSVPFSMKCNFYDDCARGEDEAECGYKDSGCWPDGYVHGQHCYHVVRNQEMSWLMAEQYCEQQFGAHLVTINTKVERSFIDKLRTFLGNIMAVTFLGLKRMRIQQVGQIYRRMWQWTDGTTAYYLPDEYRYEGWSTCALLHSDYFHSTDCGALKRNVSFICERTMVDLPTVELDIVNQMPGNSHLQSKLKLFHCRSSHEYISIEQRCDKVDNCFDRTDEMDCNYEELEATMFACETSGLLAYSFVCDGIAGCRDSSDETRCKKPKKADVGHTLAVCTDGMVLKRDLLCDGREDCLDASDEEDCNECVAGSTLCPMIACLPEKWAADQETDCPIRDLKGGRTPERGFTENIHPSKEPPGSVIPDGYGKFNISKTMSNPCPPTHFQCREGFCIPIYMWCNGFADCPHKEDEISANCKKVCQNNYKCKHSSVCVSQEHICDGHYQCPKHDDELLCSFLNQTCPDNCSCVRMEWTCRSAPVLHASIPVPVRYLRLEHANLTYLKLDGIAEYSLIYLNVSSCQVQHIGEDNMRYLNLKTFDASHNQISELSNDTFKHCPVLQKLILSHNQLINQNFSFLNSTRELWILDMSYNSQQELLSWSFTSADKLQELILSYMGIEIIRENAFVNLTSLRRLDLKGNNIIYFSSTIFKELNNLRHISTDNYRLCCDHVKPKNQHVDCNAPYDEISSCADILRTLLLRAALWIMAVLTIVGNVSVIVYRIFFDRGLKNSFRIIITCLSASDLIMGVYLVIIGTADAMYRDNYQDKEREWTSSVSCQAAGFLCLLSSETSALFIFLVTLDRLLAIAFPLHPHFHFNGKSAAVACLLVWLIGLLMALVPLLPPYQHWHLYTQKAVGVPLPITRSYFPGYDYAFAIFILFNMIVFLLVALGQLLIYLSVHLQKHPQISEARVRQDTAIAKRLVLVVLTDCLCWFPITVMGLAARSGLPVPGEMYVIATVFLLPANSAFNPFLYTANAILLARRMRRKKKQALEAEFGLCQLSR